MSEIRDPESGRGFTADEAAWIASHRTELRRDVSERRFRNQILVTGLAIGLIVHVIGFLLKASATDAPVALVADLLYAFGFALWTGVVVLAFVEIIPRAKERQISRWLDAYDAAVGRRPGHATVQKPGDQT